MRTEIDQHGEIVLVPQPPGNKGYSRCQRKGARRDPDIFLFPPLAMKQVKQKNNENPQKEHQRTGGDYEICQAHRRIPPGPAPGMTRYMVCST